MPLWIRRRFERSKNCYALRPALCGESSTMLLLDSNHGLKLDNADHYLRDYTEKRQNSLECNWLNVQDARGPILVTLRKYCDRTCEVVKFRYVVGKTWILLDCSSIGVPVPFSSRDFLSRASYTKHSRQNGWSFNISMDNQDLRRQFDINI